MKQVDQETFTQLSKDGFIFSGNRQESVPRTLFLDKRLTPLERNAWQVIRIMLEPDGITALPTYEQLRSYLINTPYAEKASFETVARAITILRLARWLSLVKKRRAKDGTKQSNLYVLHDDPLTPFEAMRLDEEFFILVCQSIEHASRAIQHVAAGVLEDIANDPYLSGKRLPTRLEVLLGRMVSTNDDATPENLSTTHESEEGQNSLLRNQNDPTSESEVSLKPAKNHMLRNPNKAVVVSSNHIKILLQGTQKELNLPQRFYQLSIAQQKGILKTIKNLDITIQQQIFDEWKERCKTQAIRKPAAYLYGIAQNAFRGEFNKLAEPLVQPQPLLTTPATVKPMPTQSEYVPPTPEEKEQIRQQLQSLKESFLRKD